MPLFPEFQSIEDEAIRALEQGLPYKTGAVLIERLRTPGRHTFRVTFATRVVRETEDLRAAVATMLYFLQRRCSSCGSPGCGFDYGGRQKLEIEPLPEGSGPIKPA